ncbi:multiple sugar transport system substrate-binding protein [Halanaerobium salsuginis]|uniref:Multiple sugar transport system substrate-binding protein n=1 Tax=Halanaerobium salsuginis TaxID=29563 RepID=A0A1I4KDJ9_9FIRM|nr:extracellular solute-binding protein [Halanaerobium salsuginis]SFL76691.1 multiple sugar transport system substrate-binding protein [Halanaerobium salsuginis]
MKKNNYLLILVSITLLLFGLSFSISAADYDLTLYSILTTDPDFSDWLNDVETATGLKINVIAAPTNSDTRQQKVTTILSSGDSSIDILELNDEMASSFKNSGWLAPLQAQVLTADILKYFPDGYVSDMITSRQGDIIGVPGYSGYLAFWVDQQKLDKYGFDSIDNKEDFIAFAKAASVDGNYGYGGSWERTYVFNEIATFVNLFGGDYFDWTNPANKEAIQFMYDMVHKWQVTPIEQLADKYEQLNQKFIDGKYAMIFMWGTGAEYRAANRYGQDQIHMAMMPEFKTRSIFTDSWSYVLNSASKNKEAAYKFLRYVAGEQGMLSAWDNFDRFPARSDVAKEIPENEITKMYQRYSEECIVRGRPMAPQTMEFITQMGTIFQQAMQDKITIDEFCQQAQSFVEQYK